MSKNPNITMGRFLSQALRELASEQHDIGTSESLTRAQCLAKLVWDNALGYTRMIKNKEGMLVEQSIEPRTWAINIIFDRLEGRIPVQDDNTKEKEILVDKVEKLCLKKFEDLSVDDPGD